MRVQLLNPPTHVTPGNLQATKPSAPLGLAYVAAALRKAGHDVSVIDALGEAPDQVSPAGPMQRVGLTDAQILDRVDPGVQAIGVTNMFSFNWPAVRGILHALHARFPDKLIVCGGEHFTALTDLSMRTAPIDYVVCGEGEDIAVELFNGLDAGAAFRPEEVRGLSWRRNGEIVKNPRAERNRAIDQIPWPAWELFDLQGYSRREMVHGLPLGKTVPILATRGCPYQCTYCSSPRMWTTRWYTRDPVDVVNEIQSYHERYGATNFPFHDLTMIVKKDWIVQFCEEIISRHLPITWQLPSGTRCEVIDDEVAPLLWKSGCRWLCYAPESGSEHTRELIKKRMKTESLLRAVDAAVAAGLRLETFFVIGFPHDTRDDLRASLRLARKLAIKGVEDTAVNFFFPIPETELFDYLATRGRITPSDEHLMAPAFGHHFRLMPERNFCEHLSAKELSRWRLWIAANFYFTSWASHPLRVPRVLYHALTGQRTSALERFLGNRMSQLFRRRRPEPEPLPSRAA